MSEPPSSITLIDTLLAGRAGYTACYFLPGENPAIIDPGAQTSTQTVIDALRTHGLGPNDLAWIVLTHIHLDHCGGTGGLADAFPHAQVVVHRRGARHLTEPARLVAATAAVHGPRASLYGGLEPTAAERIVIAEDGHTVDVGAGRRLTMFETVGHARHHMSIVDSESGAVFAGDAVGVTFPGGGVYPAMPPSDIDFEGWQRSLDRIAEHDPQTLYPTHFDAVSDPSQTIATVRAQLEITALAARDAWRTGSSVAAISAALDQYLPLADWVGDPDAIAHWEFVGWRDANPDGVAAWARDHQDVADDQ